MVTTGILFHVNHLEAKAWEELVWGRPDLDRFGTAVKFAYTLLNIPSNEDVRSVIFSGPSTKDGLIEGAYTKRFLLSRIDQLSEFPSLKKTIDTLSRSEYDLFVERVNELTVGPVIKNTLEEVIRAADFFNTDQPADKVYQIAAASHAPRCLKNQLMARHKNAIPRHQPWYMAASDVCYMGTEIEDVVILEPPHRADDPMLDFRPTISDVVKPYYALHTEGQKRFIRTIADTLSGKED